MNSSKYYYIDILLNALKQLRLNNPTFSIASFARFLNVSKSSLEKCLKGEYPLGFALASCITQKLNFTDKEVIYFYESIVDHKRELGHSRGFRQFEEYLGGIRPFDYGKKISAESFKEISEWYHFAILTISKTENFEPTVDHIAKRLGIPLALAEEAVGDLIKAGVLINWGKDNYHFIKNISYYRGNDLDSKDPLFNHMDSILVKARDYILKEEVKSCHFYSGSVASDEERVASVQGLLQESLCDVRSRLTLGKKEKAYQVLYAIYPLEES